MHKWFKKVLDVGAEEVIRALLVAGGGALLTAAAVWIAHLRGIRGVWIDRGITVILTLVAVVLVTGALAAAPRVRARLFAREESDSPKGFLDHRADAEEAAIRLGKTMQRIPPLFTSLTQEILGAVKKFGSAKSSQDSLRASRHTAKIISRSARQIERLLPEMRRDERLFSEGYLGYFRWLTPKNEQSRAQLIGDRGSVAKLLTTTEEFDRAMRGMQESKQETKKASRDLHRSLTEHDRVIGDLIGIVGKTHETCVELIAIMDDKLK
ncbi:MAG TPA: hypothetical protein VGQ75_11190 [Thermoanaerobaculia bacterium]|jgi:hypothetical protein|nr:hypothetical protein [Thermoanaerobaculia bacterium]